jgi:hypothetical protein
LRRLGQSIENIVFKQKSQVPVVRIPRNTPR